MKNIYRNLILFVLLSVAISGFTACLDSTNSTDNTADNSVQTVSNADKDSVKNSDYPSLPQGIMNAEIKNVDGTTFKMSDKKGKVVLLNLWATWCGPCIAEMPDLIEMQNKYKDNDFEIVGLNIGEEGVPETREVIEDFAKKQNLNYQLAYADNDLFGEFYKITQMPGIPQSVLVNRDGKMTGVFTGSGSRVIDKMKETVAKTVNE